MSNQNSQVLFTGDETFDDSPGAFSRIASVQSRGQVSIFVDNGGTQTVTLTVYAGSATPGQSGGRNSLPDNPDAGDLFPYIEADGTGTRTFAVVAGAKACFELSPFSPEFVGLKAVGTAETTDLVAYATAHA